jgi:hypothetical protein
MTPKPQINLQAKTLKRMRTILQNDLPLLIAAIKAGNLRLPAFFVGPLRKQQPFHYRCDLASLASQFSPIQLR